MTEEYCRRNDLRLIDTFLDAGLSAYTGANLGDQGALRTLLDGAKLGKFRPGTRLIVESLDRLSRREISVAVRLFLDIIDTGLVIVTLIDGEQIFTKERIDNDLTALIVAIVILSRANNESKNKRERALQAQRVARQKAREFKAPISAICPSWLKVVGTGEARHFIVDKRRGKIIERIFKLAASGLGQFRIAEHLNRYRVPTLNGHPGWDGGMVSRVLNKNAVVGTFQPYYWHRGEYGSYRVPDPEGPIKDYFPPIISRELYDRAKFSIESRQTRRMKRGPRLYANLVRGLGRCAICGGTLRYYESMSGFHYLRCAHSRHKLCSNSSGFPYWKLEPLLTALDELMKAVADDIERSPLRNRAQVRRGLLSGSRETFFLRLCSAKQKINDSDVEQRRHARKALWAELRRLIDSVVLQAGRAIAIHLKPDAAGSRLILNVGLDGFEGIEIRFANGGTRFIPQANMGSRFGVSPSPA